MSKKSPAVLRREINEALAIPPTAPYESKYGHGPDERRDGFKYGREAALDEIHRYNRASARATLDQLQAYARNDFDLGQVEGYRDALGDVSAYGWSAPEASSPTRADEVKVDTTIYRQTHGAEPRGRADGTFVIGKASYDLSDDPALYRPARARGVKDLPYAKARDHAIAEAKRRRAVVVGVGA